MEANSWLWLALAAGYFTWRIAQTLLPRKFSATAVILAVLVWLVALLGLFLALSPLVRALFILPYIIFEGLSLKKAYPEKSSSKAYRFFILPASLLYLLVLLVGYCWIIFS